MKRLIYNINEFRLPIIGLGIFAILFYGPTLIGAQIYYWGLPSLQFYPWRHVAFESISNGALPLWNSYNGMGAPLLANYQLAILYPPTWIIYLFEWVGGISWMAWSHTLVNLFHFFLAGLGMAALVKKHKGSSLAQSISALAFSASGYFLARQGVFPILWTAAWLPWICLFASDLASPFGKIETPTKESIINPKLVISLMFMLLAGHAQLSWYFVWFCGAWVLIGALIEKKPFFKTVLRYVLSGFLAAGIAAVQLIPTAELLFESQRATEVDFVTAAAYSFWPWRWITLLAPNFFGNPGTADYWGYASYWEDAIYFGILPFGLAIAVLVRVISKREIIAKKGVVFSWIGILFVAVFAMGKFTPFYPYLYRVLPSVDMFHAPTRIMILAIFLLVFMAGIFSDNIWIRPTGRGLYWARLSTAGCFAVTIGAAIGWILLGEISPTFIRATAISGLIALGFGLLTLFKPEHESKHFGTWQWIVILWMIVDLSIASIGVAPTIPMDEFDFESSVTISETRKDSRIFISPEDEQWLRHKRFYRFSDFSFLEPIANVYDVPIANTNSLSGVLSVSNFDPLLSKRYQAWMESIKKVDQVEFEADLQRMGVGIELTRDAGTPSLHEHVISYDGYQKMVRMAECGVVARDFEEALQLVSNGKLELNQVVIEAGNEGEFSECSTEREPNKVVVTTFIRGWNKINVEYNSSRDGILVIAESFFPGWVARIDGVETELYPADVVFWGIFAPQGKHQIEFAYQPFSLKIGLLISVLSIVVFAVILSNKRIQHN